MTSPDQIESGRPVSESTETGIEMTRTSMMGVVRRTKKKARGSGFSVTWDVNSRDRSATNRLQAFLYGRRVEKNGREYVYDGFVWKDGVRYLGQSTVFVLPHRLSELTSVLSMNRIDTRFPMRSIPNSTVTESSATVILLHSGPI